MQIRTRLTLWFIGITALTSAVIAWYLSISILVIISRRSFTKALESKAVMTVVMLVKNNPELETEKGRSG
jgi:hypothetical protein